MHPRTKRKIRKALFVINGYLFHSDKIIRGQYKPVRQPYVPVNKWNEALLKPHLPEEFEDSPVPYIFVLMAFGYVIFGVLIR